jgi:hypothetical protein
MDNKVKIMLVADDAQFLRDLDRAGQRGGELAGREMVSRFSSTSESGLRNWQVPGSKSIGEKAGFDIGAGIANALPVPIAGATSNAIARRDDPFAPISLPTTVIRREPSVNIAPLPTVKKRETPSIELAPLPTVTPRNQRNPQINGGGFGGLLDSVLNGSDPTQDPVIKNLIEQQERARAEAEKARIAAEKQAQRQREINQRSQQQLNVGSQQLTRDAYRKAELGTSDDQGKRDLRYEADRQDITNKYDNKRVKFTSDIEKLTFDRNQAVSVGDYSQDNFYQQQIDDVQKLIAENEKLRESELQILQVQKAQADVLARRKTEDQRVKDSRSQRDQELASGLSQRTTQLNSEKVGTTDKVSLAAINTELARVRAEAAKTKEVNRTNDRLEDLGISRNRRDENRRLGISDPKLENINFERERSGLIDRRQTAEVNYEKQKTTLAGNFQETVNAQNKKSQQVANQEATKLEIDSLKTQLASTSDETVKVKLQFQIDQAELTAKVEKTKEQLQSTLNTLRQRQNTLSDAGVVDPSLNKLITEQEGLIVKAEENRQEAQKVLAAQALLNGVVAEARNYRNSVSNTSLLYKPRLDLAEAQSKSLIEQDKFSEASVPGRAAAIGNEELRYQKQQSDFAVNIGNVRAAGGNIPQAEVDKTNAAIDSIHSINLGNIKAQFDELNGSINSTHVAFRKLGEAETNKFLYELISGTKSFDDIWRATVNNIIQGMIKILAQNFTKERQKND